MTLITETCNDERQQSLKRLGSRGGTQRCEWPCLSQRREPMHGRPHAQLRAGPLPLRDGALGDELIEQPTEHCARGEGHRVFGLETRTAGGAEHEPVELGALLREREVGVPRGVEACDRPCTRRALHLHRHHRLLHARREALEATHRHRHQQRVFVFEVPVRRVGRDPDLPRDFAQTEGLDPDPFDEPQARVDERISKISVVIRGLRTSHPANVDSVNFIRKVHTVNITNPAPLNVVVFGATGLTGGLVVDRALAQGHRVTALVRKPEAWSRTHERLVVRGGSPTSPADVEAVVRGADVVVHCLGVGGKGTGQPTTLISDSVKVTLAAMEKHGVRRIVCMSNVGVSGSGPWLLRAVVRAFMGWLQHIVDDKVRMESALRDSKVEWVSVRLVGISDGPAKPVRVTADGRGLSMTITAASIAEFMLARMTGPEFLRETPSISN